MGIGEILAFVLGVIAVILAVVVTRRVLRKRAARRRYYAERQAAWRAEQNRQLIQLGELKVKAQGGDYRALLELKPRERVNDGDWWWFIHGLNDPELLQQFSVALDAGFAKWHYDTHFGKLSELAQAYRVADNLADKVSALRDYACMLTKAYTREVPDGVSRIETELEFSKEDAVKLLDELLPEYFAWLIQQAERGDRQAFVTAESLYSDSHRTRQTTSQFYQLSILGLKRPEAVLWNALVVRFYRSPDFGQLVTTGLSARDIVDLAADAVRDNDVVTAQLVIAACASRENGSWIRSQVGDIRYNELSSMASTVWDASHAFDEQ